MTPRNLHRRETVTRAAVAVAVTLTLLGAGVGARALLAEESAQAHAYVAEGQRALAQGDRATAVLSIERARRFAPRERAVRAAVESAGVKEAEPLLSRLARLLTSREWAAVATVSGWISGLGIALAVARWHRRYAVRAALAAGCAFVVGMAAIMESNASTPGVVTGRGTELLVAPYVSAAAEEALPAGSTVLLGDRYETFVHVKSGDGASGWVPRDRVEAVVGSEG